MAIELDEDGQDWRTYKALVEENGSPQLEDDVAGGYWRYESGQQIATPVISYFDDGMLIVRFPSGCPFLEGNPPDIDSDAGAAWHKFSMSIWPKLKAYPYDEVNAAVETGFWEDGLPVAKRDGIGANEGPEAAIEAMLKQAEEAIAKAEKLIGAGAAKTKKKSDEAANLMKSMSVLKGTVDETREKEKEPHLKAAQAVDARFMPVIKKLNALSNQRSGDLRVKVVAPYLAEQERVRQAAANAAQAVIDEQARVAQEAAAAEEAERIANLPEGEKPPAVTDEEWAGAAPQEPGITIVADKASAGARGAKVSLRNVRYGIVVDAGLMAKTLGDGKHPDIMPTLRDIAIRMARLPLSAELKNGEEVFPGVKLEIRRE